MDDAQRDNSDLAIVSGNVAAIIRRHISPVSHDRLQAAANEIAIEVIAGIDIGLKHLTEDIKENRYGIRPSN